MSLLCAFVNTNVVIHVYDKKYTLVYKLLFVCILFLSHLNCQFFDKELRVGAIFF